MTLSEESGIGYRQERINNKNYTFLLSVSFPRTRREVPSLRGDRGKLAYTGQNI